MSHADVFNLGAMSAAIHALYTAQSETGARCKEGICKAEQLCQETQNELKISEGLLIAARAEEEIRLGLLLEAEARLAAALAQEAAAASSGNFLAAAAAAAEVAAANAERAEANDAYRRAQEHREQIENRQELAQKCVALAQENQEVLCMRYQYGKTRIDGITHSGCYRLQAAQSDLEAYLSRISPQARQNIKNYRKWEPKEKQPIDPKEVHDRLNPDAATIDGILEYLYATDPKFRCSIDRLCTQMESAENTVAVEVKIRKNVVGRLCEEIVIQAFQPMGKCVETQHKCALDNGSFTKVDMILYGLKEPLILGRGENRYGRKNGSIAIEVKSGKAEYIYSQAAHMEVQAKGHQSCDVSCTVCTRDINDLSPEQKEEVKARLSSAGSPLLGMLPRKSELDTHCIRFVKAKAGTNHVQ